MNVIIENSKFKAEISSLGAEIQHFIKKSDGSELIWNGDSSVWKNHAPILFPFVNRCLGGYFIIDGKKCEYTRNHGFARDLETKIVSQDENKVVFQLTESDDTLCKFPYKFILQTEYELTESGLNWTIKVINTDTKDFSFSVGTHAAFSAPRNTDPEDTQISDYEIVFEKEEALTGVKCTPDGFITNDGIETFVYGEEKNGVIPLTDKGFGNGHLFTNFKSEWVGLKNKKTGEIMSISTKDFPYCMIWQNTSGAPQFVCIEPWYGVADCENTDHIWEHKIGLNLLKAGETFISQQNIVLR